MKKLLRGLLSFCLIGMFLVPGVGFAEEGEVAALKAQIDALSRKLEAMDSKMMTMEKPAPGAQTTYIPPTPDAGTGGVLQTAMKDIHMGGYVETQYTGNLDAGKGTNIGRSLSDKSKDTFSVPGAKLWFEKLANPEGGAGFRIDMMMGSDTRYFFNNFQTNNLGTANGGSSGSTSFAFEQAYVQLVMPLTFWGCSKILPKSVDVKAGRMVTLAGNEVIEGYNNWNISRSVSFGYAIPFTHTGLRAQYSLFDGFLTVYNGVNNGWDNDIDGNTYKTLENAFSFSPIKNTKWTTATYFGPELTNAAQVDGPNGRKRFLITNVASWDATDKLSFTGEFDYGNQNRFQLNSDGFLDHRATWYDLAGYVKYKFTDKWAAAYRMEWFDDAQRYRNWTNSATGLSATKNDFGNTLTLEYKPYENVIARGEYRIDSANSGVFNTGRHSQNTLGGQLIYLFG
ncbi:MAG: outer membrane beta-barrel protein [Candidatus Omnitrophota bacterium]